MSNQLLITFINTTMLYGVVLNMQVDRKRQAGFTTTQMDFSASVRYWRRAWQPTAVFLPGESPGQKSLVGYRPRGHKESDTTEWLTLGIGVFCMDLTTWKWASSRVFLLHSDSRQPSAGTFPPCDTRMMQGGGRGRDVCLQLSSAVMGGCKPRTEPHSSPKMNSVSVHLIYSQNSMPTAYCKLPEYKCGAGKDKLVCRF